MKNIKIFGYQPDQKKRKKKKKDVAFWSLQATKEKYVCNI